MKSRGWCRAHYLRWYKTGDPTKIRPGKWDGYVRPACRVDECDSPAHARGLCQVHYPRMKRHGDPEAISRSPSGTPFWDLVDHSGDCWEWLGGKTTAGYPQFQGGYAHRLVLDLVGRGTPDEGMQVHHVCLNRGCVNPDHLEVVTPREHHDRHAALRRSS